MFYNIRRHSDFKQGLCGTLWLWTDQNIIMKLEFYLQILTSTSLYFSFLSLNKNHSSLNQLIFFIVTSSFNVYSRANSTGFTQKSNRFTLFLWINSLEFLILWNRWECTSGSPYKKPNIYPSVWTANKNIYVYISQVFDFIVFLFPRRLVRGHGMQSPPSNR